MTNLPHRQDGSSGRSRRNSWRNLTPPSRFHMRVQPRVCPRQAPVHALPLPSAPLNPPTHLAALAGGLRLKQISPLLPSPSGGAAAGASLEVARGGDEVGGRHRRPARGAKRVVSRRLLVLLRGLGLLVLVTKGAASVRAHAACAVHMHMCRVCSAHSVQVHMQCTSSSCSPAALPLHVLLVRPLLRLRVGTARDQISSPRSGPHGSTAVSYLALSGAVARPECHECHEWGVAQVEPREPVPQEARLGSSGTGIRR